MPAVRSLRSWLRPVRSLALCALLAGPAAVNGRALPPPPGPSAAQLAALVFPGWNDTRFGRLQNVALPTHLATPRVGWNAGMGPGAARVIVDPKLVLRTDAGHVTLIAAMVPAGADGRPAVAHMTPVGVAAYQFEREGGDWKIAGRQGIFAWRGFFGEVRLQSVTLAASPKGAHQAVGIEYGSCWDGYCGTWLALYEVDANAVRHEPAVETSLSGNNIDGAPDCLHRLQPAIKPRTRGTSVHDDGSPPGAHDCYLVDSSWSIDPAREQPGDLTIRYEGAISRADSYGGLPATVDQSQVLRYDHGKYRAVSGFNPVPPI